MQPTGPEPFYYGQEVLVFNASSMQPHIGKYRGRGEGVIPQTALIELEHLKRFTEEPTPRRERYYTVIEVAMGNVSPYKTVPVEEHDRRVTELLAANTAEKDRRSAALAMVNKLQEELSKWTSMSTMGVGDGAGKLFVYGDHASIKACQELILARNQNRNYEASMDVWDKGINRTIYGTKEAIAYIKGLVHKGV
jgi:hypothetical protein